MKIQWGMMMTDGRGKLGGQVASKNRAGSYIRTKVSPSNPQTSYQGAVRSIFSILSKKWSESLTDVQRKQWNVGASSGIFAKNDVFGNSRNPSGFNLFVGMNSLQHETGGRHIVTPPRKANFTEFTVSGAGVASDGSMMIGIQVSETPPVGTKWQIEATAPVPPGRYYLKNLFRSITTTETVAVGGAPLNIAPAYGLRFGALTAENEGQRVGFRVRQVSDGQATPWVEVSTIVVDEITP